MNGQNDNQPRYIAEPYHLKTTNLANLQRKQLMPKRILIVDDEPFNVISMQLCLSRLGIKGLGSLVDRAYNGLDGLNLAKDSFLNGKHTYGLIITDISMPVMDGYEAS